MPNTITGRFGVEIELNSLDSRDFVKNPLKKDERPCGIDRVASIVSSLGLKCDVHDWKYNHNPSTWSCKPDNSCGIELCSPVMSDAGDLREVMDALADDDALVADRRCAFHVHLELAGMDLDESVASIPCWWIKCEHVFMDFADPSRKNNKYCRPIGITDIVSSDDQVIPEVIFKKLAVKYLSLNAFHLFNRRRPSLEFRIAEGTKDFGMAGRWVEILLAFADRAVSAGIPSDYRWIRPREVLEFMRLEGDLEDWFLRRLMKNSEADASEFFSAERRRHARENYASILRERSAFLNGVSLNN